MVGAKLSLYTSSVVLNIAGYRIHLRHLLRHLHCLSLIKSFSFFFFLLSIGPQYGLKLLKCISSQLH